MLVALVDAFPVWQVEHLCELIDGALVAALVAGLSLGRVRGTPAHARTRARCRPFAREGLSDFVVELSSRFLHDRSFALRDSRDSCPSSSRRSRRRRGASRWLPSSAEAAGMLDTARHPVT